jgi:preprotein translocase subunit SecD
MKKSTLWQTVVSALLILLAALVALDIEHPDWAKSLLFWQPANQRDIALRYGVELSDSYRILLTPDEAAKPDEALMKATLSVVKNRAKSLSMTDPAVQLQGNLIVVHIPRWQDISVMTQTLQARGLVEFIDVGTEAPTALIGATVETNLGEPPSAESQEALPESPLPTPRPTPTPAPITTTSPTATVTASPAATPTATITATEPTPTPTPTPTPPSSPVYQTVLTNNQLEYIELQQVSGNYAVKYKLTSEAEGILGVYNQAHPGEYLCITLDKQVLACILSNSILQNVDQAGNLLPARSYAFVAEEDFQPTMILLRSGILPVPLRVGSVDPAGSALGEKATASGIAVAVGLVAVLVFLLLHYRLPGLLADLALLIFALFSLALCKILPLPLTLASVTGLAATALVALWGLLSVAERLRERARADYPLPKAIEASFSATWPAIRNVHLVFLLLSIATSLIGATVAAQTIHWLGIALLAGTLTSLFVTMIFSRTLLRLILTIDAVQEWLNERKWLLGI